MNEVEKSLLKAVREYQIYYYTSADCDMNRNWKSFLDSLYDSFKVMIADEAMDRDIKKIVSKLLVEEL